MGKGNYIPHDTIDIITYSYPTFTVHSSKHANGLHFVKFWCGLMLAGTFITGASIRNGVKTVKEALNEYW